MFGLGPTSSAHHLLTHHHNAALKGAACLRLARYTLTYANKKVVIGRSIFLQHQQKKSFMSHHLFNTNTMCLLCLYVQNVAFYLQLAVVASTSPTTSSSSSSPCSPCSSPSPATPCTARLLVAGHLCHPPLHLLQALQDRHSELVIWANSGTQKKNMLAHQVPSSVQKQTNKKVCLYYYWHRQPCVLTRQMITQYAPQVAPNMLL